MREFHVGQRVKFRDGNRGLGTVIGIEPNDYWGKLYCITRDAGSPDSELYADIWLRPLTPLEALAEAAD